MRHVQSQRAARVHSGTRAPTRSTRAIAACFPRARAFPVAYAFGPGARTLYVASFGAGAVTPVDVRTGKAAGPLNVGAYNYPTVITITGQTAVVIEPYGYSVELINLKTRRVFPPIAVGAFPTAVAITA